MVHALASRQELNPLTHPITDVLLGLGVANAFATASIWYCHVRSGRTTVVRRQALLVVSALISVTVSSFTYLGLVGGWLYNVLYRRTPGAFSGSTRLSTVSILVGLLTAGYPFFCTMVGDAESRAERIRIFISAVVAGFLWLSVLVAASIPPV